MDIVYEDDNIEKKIDKDENINEEKMENNKGIGITNYNETFMWKSFMDLLLLWTYTRVSCSIID